MPLCGPQSTVHKGLSAREARESPRPSSETPLTAFRLIVRRAVTAVALAALALGVGGSAIVDQATAMAALPEPVAYTGAEYDGTGDAAERLQRLGIARDVAIDARLAIAVKKTKPATVQTGSTGGGGSSSPPVATGPSKPATGKAATVVAFVKAQVGKRYVFATSGPNTYDCSGLVKAAYARIGISLPHQTGGLIRKGRAVSRSALAPGDLVFPSSGHVGIYIGGGLMVHASNQRTGVKASTVYAFYAARRIL